MIVIGLLGAIALIVIAAINPIEQANRARDTRFKADSGQLISAIDRYFVSTDEFPWMTLTSTLTAESAVTFVSATSQSIGLCGAAANCADDGYLIVNNELKTEFKNRDFITDTGTDPSLRVWVGKATGSSASVYACFIPLSQSERSKDDNLVNLAFSGGNPTTCTTSDWEASPCYVCLPQ